MLDRPSKVQKVKRLRDANLFDEKTKSEKVKKAYPKKEAK